MAGLIRQRGLALHLDAAEADDFPDCTVHASAAMLPGRRRAAGQRLCVSVHDDPEIDAARRAGADLLLWGHVFATPSKSGRVGRGLAALTAAVERASPLPLIAVGGLGLGHEEAVLATGAAGLAAIRAPFGGRNVAQGDISR